MSAVLQLFREKLPHKPYCTNDFTYGVRILPKDIAILARFIQQNQPHAQHWLAFDVDRTGALRAHSSGENRAGCIGFGAQIRCRD